MKQQRYVFLVLVVAAVLMGMIVQNVAIVGLDQAGVADERLGGLFPTSTVAGVVGAVVTFFALLRNRKMVRFTDEVLEELIKVTWPTREETLRATTTVIFTTLFVAALLGVYDLVWKSLADWVLFTEG